MLYIQESLGPHEELVHIGQFHWTYMIGAALYIVWGVGVAAAIMITSVYIYKETGTLPPYMSLIEGIQHVSPIFRALSFFFLVVGVIGYTARVVQKTTTEIAITNSRIVFKEGLISRHVGEIDIHRIEGVNVLQSIMGRLLGYGRVAIRGMGVGEVTMPPIADPIEFRKAIDAARTLHKRT